MQLDITGEFSNGFLPGVISISTKLLPTVMNLLKKLADEGAGVRSGASSTANNLNRTNSKTTNREMQDLAAGTDSVSNGRVGNNSSTGDGLRQRQVNAT